MGDVLGAPLVTQTLNYVLHVLNTILLRHQHGVRRLDDDHVANTHGSQEPALCDKQGILGRLGVDIAPDHIPLGVLVPFFP